MIVAKNSNKWIILVSLVLIIVSLSLVLLPKTNASSPSFGVSTIQDTAKLAGMGISFDSTVNFNLPSHLITKNDAIRIANQTFAQLDSKATNIHVEFQLVTDSAVKMFSPEEKHLNPSVVSNGIRKMPCYIVTYNGVDVTSKAILGRTPIINHEYNVLIDALTGQILFGFTYR